MKNGKVFVLLRTKFGWIDPWLSYISAKEMPVARQSIKLGTELHNYQSPLLDWVTKK
jgi:hypothetical protein